MKTVIPLHLCQKLQSLVLRVQEDPLEFRFVDILRCTQLVTLTINASYGFELYLLPNLRHLTLQNLGSEFVLTQLPRLTQLTTLIFENPKIEQPRIFEVMKTTKFDVYIDKRQ